MAGTVSYFAWGLGFHQMNSWLPGNASPWLIVINGLFNALLAIQAKGFQQLITASVFVASITRI
jgi:hypothetical protein